MADALRETEYTEFGLYRVDGMMLKCVSVIVRGAVNAVLICRDVVAPAQPYYTLLVVSDRAAAKSLVTVFADNERDAVRPPCLNSFVHGEDLCFLFEYRSERRLADFAPGQLRTPSAREDICVNLLLACIESALPWPLLYLLLDQGRINIEKDNSVFLSPIFDLEALDASVTESDCVTRCAKVVLGVLRMGMKRELKSCLLIRRKAERKAYAQFTDIYHDLRLTALKEKKRFGLAPVKAFFGERKDFFFRLLLVCSLVCAVAALIILVGYLIFGDVTLFRFFGQSLHTIGTERLDAS